MLLIFLPAIVFSQFKTVEDILGPELMDENRAVHVFNIIDCIESGFSQKDSNLNIECANNFSKIIINTKINRIKIQSPSKELHFYSNQFISSENQINVFLSEETGDSVAVRWMENYKKMDFFFKREKKLLTFFLK